MISRSRFFLASLWAALAPVGIVVVAATWVVLFPDIHDLGDLVHLAGRMTLIGVPFVYTAGVVVTYAIARGLYELHALSRRSLIAAYGLLSVFFSVGMTLWLGAGTPMDMARSFALFLTLSFIASGSAAFLWWRSALRKSTDPNAVIDEQPEPRVRVRRRKRKSLIRELARRL